MALEDAGGRRRTPADGMVVSRTVTPAAADGSPPSAPVLPGLPNGPATDGAEVRVLLYSHDGFGLGHLQRNFNIARHLAAAIPGASALLVAGSPHGFDCRLPPGVDWIKIPSVIRRGSGRWEPRTLGVSRERVRELRAGAIRSAVETFRPHLVVVDHLPTGVWGELIPTLEFCQGLAAPPRIVLGLRDILDRPETTRRQWMRQGAYEALEKYYDRVLIYGDREVFATAEVYGLSECMAGKVAYCGYVGPSVPRRAARRVRRELALRPHEKLVVVCGGGGADAYGLMTAAAEALARLAAERSLRAILLTGPLMGERRRQALRRRIAGLPIEVWWQVEDQPALLGAADLVVSMAGYNTMTEALMQRRRLVVAPRAGPSAEQTLRAAAFARRGLITMLPPTELSAARLAGLIERHLTLPLPPAAGRPRMDGLREVVRELRSLLPGAAAPGRGASAGRPSGHDQGAKPNSA
jgi:predicted glycosyltransferase